MTEPLIVPDVSATTRALIEMLIQRDQHGRAKYGTTLDRTDLSHADWLQHMAEEMLDGAGYALAAKRTRCEITDETKIAGLHMEDGKLCVGLAGGACEAFARAFAEQFLESGAVNYIEARFASELGQLVVTLQRAEGMTPHQLRAEAEADLAAARAEAESLRNLLDHGEWFRQDERTHLAVRVADGADLSCKANRQAAIDAAIAAQRGGSKP